MNLSEYLSFWTSLTSSQQEQLTIHTRMLTARRGTILHRGSNDCSGLILVRSGQLRAYITSEDGREITLYRLLDRDICLLSASCIMKSIQFDIFLSAEKDTDYALVPAELYQQLMNESAPAANFTNDLMGNRFSEIMWLMEQIMWKSFDKRLAEFLLEESSLEGSSQLKITHEMIGNHLGHPREVVTRMLRYFQNEGIVKLSRGTVEILNVNLLHSLLNN